MGPTISSFIDHYHIIIFILFFSLFAHIYTPPTLHSFTTITSHIFCYSFQLELITKKKHVWSLGIQEQRGDAIGRESIRPLRWEAWGPRLLEEEGVGALAFGPGGFIVLLSRANLERFGLGEVLRWRPRPLPVPQALFD